MDNVFYISMDKSFCEIFSSLKILSWEEKVQGKVLIWAPAGLMVFLVENTIIKVK